MGVMMKLERVIMIVCASPSLPLAYSMATAPAPPARLTGTKATGASFCFSIMPEMKRA